MADSFFSSMCSFALKQLGMESLEHVKQWLGDHFSDQGRRLTNALKESNEKAWRALEIALAGESLWNKLDRADDRAFRQQLAAFLKQLPMPELQGKQNHRKKIQDDIREAKKKGLTAGRLSPEELGDRVGPMADRSDPQKVLAAEKKALSDMAAVLRRAGLLRRSPGSGAAGAAGTVAPGRLGALLLPPGGGGGRGIGAGPPVHGDGAAHRGAAEGLPGAGRRAEGARRPRRAALGELPRPPRRCSGRPRK